MAFEPGTKVADKAPSNPQEGFVRQPSDLDYQYTKPAHARREGLVCVEWGDGKEREWVPQADLVVLAPAPLPDPNSPEVAAPSEWRQSQQPGQPPAQPGAVQAPAGSPGTATPLTPPG